MQLQKLAYFSHGWNLAIGGEPLISEPVEAWNYGPVYRDLYDHTKYFGKSPINRLITPDDDEAARFFTRSSSKRPPYKADLSEKQREIVDQVWRRYGRLSGPRLSQLTHQPSTPWFETFKSGRSESIDNEMIKSHYERLARRAQQTAAAA